MLKLILLIIAAAVFANGGHCAENIYSFTMKDINGKDVPLSDFKGKTLLIVNTASKCGFTPQYKSLQALYEKYKDKGFEVLAFPANNFFGQEPGSDSEIKNFCSVNYSVTFPLFSKISVKGDDIHPLYKYLTSSAGFEGDISWNFNKFIIDRNGNAAARFGSMEDPMSDKVTKKLEEVLSKQ